MAVITKIGQKSSIGKCVQCNRKRSMTVSGNTIQVGGLGNFESSERSSAKAG